MQRLTLSFFIFIEDGRTVPNIEKLRKHMLREGVLEKEELGELIGEATKIFSK